MNNNNNGSQSQDNCIVNTDNNNYVKLSIYAINTNSLVSSHKQFIMQNFLDDNNPDVVLISETKLNPSLFAVSKLQNNQK